MKYVSRSKTPLCFLLTLVAMTVFTPCELLAQGYALSFDGDDLVTFGSVTPIGSHTIEAWVKPTLFSGQLQAIAGHTGGPTLGPNLGMYLQLRPSAQLAYVVDHSAGPGPSDTIIEGGIPDLGTWVHLAGTWDDGSSTGKFYVNGGLVGTHVSSLGFAPASWMTAGAVHIAGGPQAFFTGELDELRIWSVVRTEQQIQENMAVALTGSEPGLAGYWNMDEGAGQMVYDLTQTGTTGILGTTLEVNSQDPTWVLSTAPLGGSPPAFRCLGFEAPLSNGPVTARGNRALPLKATLIDDDSNPITDLELATPPVLQVLFDPGFGDPFDVTDDALAAGQGTEGNQFIFSEDRWRFNLGTKNYLAEGIYSIVMVSGDDTEYVVDPTCMVQFVRK